MLSLSSIGALAWLLAAIAPSSIVAPSTSSTEPPSTEPPSSTAPSSTSSIALNVEPSIGSSVHTTPDVDHVVSAEGRAFATNPVEIPEAARAHGDASALDGHALGAAIFPRALEPISNESFATRPTCAIAQTTPPREPAVTPRSSRGPPRT